MKEGVMCVCVCVCGEREITRERESGEIAWRRERGVNVSSPHLDMAIRGVNAW
jgi:hypothetical protein